jgi:hypothetical protein
VLVALCSAGCGWLAWDAGPARAGAVSDAGLDPPGLAALRVSTVMPNAVSAPVVSAQGMLFVLRARQIIALDQRTNGVVWIGALPAGSTVGSAPAVDQTTNTVFVVVARPARPELLGFDTEGVRNCNPVLFRCQPVFKAVLGNAVTPPTPPVVDGGKVFANGSNALYAFDSGGVAQCTSSNGLSSCKPLWSAPTGATAMGVGPSVAGGVVFDAAASGANGTLLALDETNGTTLWSGTLPSTFATASPSIANGNVYVPAGDVIALFSAAGCGGPSCAPAQTLDLPGTDADAPFLSPAVFDGGAVFATNGNSSTYEWDASCATSTCQPTASAVVDSSGGTGYAQGAVVEGGTLFVAGSQTVSGAAHVVVLALDESDLTVLQTWDLGAGAVGTGLASVSQAASVVYVPTSSRLIALHVPAPAPLASLAVSPLTLSPAFAANTFDYAMHCASGTNSLTVTIAAKGRGTVQLTSPVSTAPSASQSVPVDVLENQAIVVLATDAQGRSAQYWIRCLPHDFPTLSVTPHPSVGRPSPGWYLMSDNFVPNGVGYYAMIVDANGTPVWYRKTATGFNVINVSSYQHDQVAYMQNFTVGFGVDPNAEYDVYDLDTNQTTSVRTAGTGPTDLHEFYRRPNGNYLLLSYPVKSGVDLTGLQGSPTPGPNDNIVDCVVQEVDPQGNVVWQWTASDHIDPRTETTETVNAQNDNGTQVYDVFHCNSIDVNQQTGNLLVSARNLNAVFEIRRSDGRILWKLGGTPTNQDGAAIIAVHNDPDNGPVEQHDARYLPNGDISLFDDQGHASLPARAVEYAVDLTNDTAHPVFTFTTPDAVSSCCMGDFRRYPDGHSVIGWGLLMTAGAPALTEINSAGRDVLDISIAGGATYRGVKVPPNRFDIDVLRATAGQ